MFHERLFCISHTPLPSEPECWKIHDDELTIDLSRARELGAAGDSMQVDAKDRALRILILHGLDGTFRAFENRCACAGFRLDVVPGEEKIKCCTLGQSTYDLSGKRLSGPTQSDLLSFPTKKNGDQLIVQLKKA